MLTSATSRARSSSFASCLHSPLPDSEFGTHGKLLAVSADGSVITTVESAEGQSAVRAYKRAGTCFTQLPDVLQTSTLSRYGTEGRLILSRDGLLSVVSYPSFDREQNHYAETNGASRVALLS